MAKISASQEISVEKLKPYTKNAKKHPKEQIDLIVRSIEEYGFLNPCLIDKDYNVIAGHGRIMAAKQMGMEKVPCLFIEGLSEAQYKAYVLADNKLTEMGEWDEEVISTLMDGKKANLVVTDPPYNVNYEGTAGKIKNDNMASDKFYKFLFDAFLCMEHAMADDASIYVFHADTEGLNFRKAFQDAGFYLSGCCIWEKPSLVLGRSPYQWQHEPCLFGWKAKGKHQWYSGRSDTTIWKFDKPKKNAEHPTMKPIPLIAYPIKNSSMTNSIVLDPFGGSGSTLIACEQTERICHTCELDEKYCDVIVNRYIEQAGSDKDVYVIRDGEKLAYEDIPKEV